MASGDTVAHEPRRLAWDGVELQLPWNWELGLYKFLRKGVTRIEVEDEYAVRLEAEWLRPTRRALKPDVILERYRKATDALARKAHETIDVQGLPPGWTASRVSMRDTASAKKKRGLDVVESHHVSAIYVCPRSEILFFVLLHFMPEDREKPEEVMRLLAGSFRHHADAALVPWKLFDIAFEMPRQFRLESASFDVGAKRMVFRWKTRRFHLWHFSCADMFLKDGVVVEQWVTGYLNGFSEIRGPIFMPGKNGEIRWRRRQRHLFGHRTEIARGCFKYRIRCHRDAKRNQLVVWVFHYRRDSDLDLIPPSLRFEAVLPSAGT
jgi:hypothetical protein